MSFKQGSKKKKEVKIPKPNIAPSNKIATPSAIRLRQNKNWVFSFSYFKQIKYFGLDRCDPKWFVSVIERLRDFSKYNIDQFESDHRLKVALRYHKIDWESPNTPIKRSDLDWLPSDYLNNDIEFPMIQFMVSMALGRIVGFWNESSDVFNIVLLDPLHNIQPSKHFSYKVDDCSPLSCQYSSLLKDIDDLKNSYKKCNECKLYDDLVILPRQNNNFNFVGCFLDDDTKEMLLEEMKIKSVNHIIELGLLADDETVT